MKYYLIMFLMLWATSAFAETEWRQKPVQCGSPDTLIKVITAAGEKALIGALTDLREPGELQSSLTPVYIFVNTDTGTFTIVEYHLSGEDVCVIGYGTGVDFNVQHLFEKKTES